MKTKASGIGEKELKKPFPPRVKIKQSGGWGTQPDVFPDCPGWLPCYNAAVGSAVKMCINIGAF